MADNMREKYASLPVTTLKELARQVGIKGLTKLKKEEIVNLLIEEEGKRKAAPVEKKPAQEQKPAQEKKPAREKKAADDKNSKEKKAPAEKKRRSSHAKSVQADVDTVETVNADTARTETARTEPAKTETAKAETARTEPAKTDTVRTEPAKTETVRTEPAKRKPGRPARSTKNVKKRNDEVHPSGAEKKDGKSSEAEDSKATEVKATRSNTEEQAIEVRKPEDKKAEDKKPEPPKYPDAKDCTGILEIMQEGYGFLRSANYMPGEHDIYVSPSQIRRFNMKTGDLVTGKTRKNNPNDKYGALLFIEHINGMNPEMIALRPTFEEMTPVFPNERIKLEYPGASVAMRIVDLFSPIGKGQRGMIVAQPKAGKTTLLKQVAASVKASHPGMHIIVLLIDERPEEVTDMKESIEGQNCEVIYSTFDELPEHHKRVSEMTIERAKRLVEQGQDVMILLDSITRLSRAYNLTVPPSGRTLSGGLDPAALYMPKRFFGAARNMREGGSLTILATALVNTGSKMDDVVYEEFKGTGNMELVLDRKLSEKRVFPAIDLSQSGTRREDLLLEAEELRAMEIIHRGLNGMRKEEATENILNMFSNTRTNQEFVSRFLARNGRM
jgi:transcription termination factor Rho